MELTQQKVITLHEPTVHVREYNNGQITGFELMEHVREANKLDAGHRRYSVTMLDSGNAALSVLYITY